MRKGFRRATDPNVSRPAFVIMKTVHVDASQITDWTSFYGAFAKAFGFPDFFGRNMDAWIDCMTNLDEEFNAVQVEPGELVCISLEGAQTSRSSARSSTRPLSSGGVSRLASRPFWWCPSMPSSNVSAVTTPPIRRTLAPSLQTP